MAAITRRLVAPVFGLLALAGAGFHFQAGAEAQAVAYEPVVGFVPNGSTMTVTPVVSDDRRYVRLSVTPFFNTFNGFTNFGIPAAVGGGGGAISAGMNGVIGQGGAGTGFDAVGYDYAQGTMITQPGALAAGAAPPVGVLGAADPLGLSNATGSNELQEAPVAVEHGNAAADEPAAPTTAAARTTTRQGGRSAVTPKARQQSSARAHKPARKTKANARPRYSVRTFDPFLESY